jgi:hypothetical protein
MSCKVKISEQGFERKADQPVRALQRVVLTA